ncbi:MAG: 3,4-dihydroxy-2-butanone-4-phosphate synthase, partial [Terriglobia bacterium]
MTRDATIEEALNDIRHGRMVVVRDSLERENEADLVMAAQKASAAHINFMIRRAGGLICVALTRERALKLGLSSMVPEEENMQPFGCNFTVSVDARRGVTTGISAEDRAATARVLGNPRAASYDLVRPGHVFPVRARTGGVLARAGHTEAAVDLARLASLSPVGVMCEILDARGKAANGRALEEMSRRFRLKMITIEQLIEYRKGTERLVDRVACAQLPTEYGNFTAYVYSCPSQNREHLALVMGRISPVRPVLVRVHSQCLTGDTLHSVRCDCREQLDSAMRQVAGKGEG